MNWIVKGYYGLGNIGDELMCKTIVEWIKELDPYGKVTVVLGRDGDESLLFRIRGVSVVSLRGNDFFGWCRLLAGIDNLVQGGGTCLHRFGTPGFYQSAAARVMGVKILWVGVGADKIKSFKQKLKASFAVWCANRVSVRDNESLCTIKTLGFHSHPSVHPDIVFRYGDVSLWPDNDEKYSIGNKLVVVWRDLYLYIRKDRLEKFYENAAWIVLNLAKARYFDRVLILNCANKVDSAACGRIYEILVENCSISVSLENNPSGLEKLQWLRNAGSVISARLHPLMLAALCHRPCFGLSYAPKIDRFDFYFKEKLVSGIENWIEDPEKVLSEGFTALSKAPNFKTSIDSLMKESMRHREVLVREIS